MTNSTINYLTDAEGNTQAVVIPIELWQQLLPQGDDSIEELAENLEDYCLSRVMDEAQDPFTESRRVSSILRRGGC